MKSKIKIDEVNFPTLYKLNTQGKIEQWSIQVRANSTNSGHSVHTTFGEYRGKMQTKSYSVLKGKNIGKKNETDSGYQAWSEAEAKHNGMLKKGYVKSLKDAKAGKTDSIIKGGIVPMAAHKWQKYSEKITYPVYVQPKLDGERCVAIYKNGKVTLWTRSRKPVLSCPHIIEQLEKALSGSTLPRFIDGELYKHGLPKKELEALMGSVRKQKPSELSAQAEFHIYDGCSFEHLLKSDFKLRWFNLGAIPDWFSHLQFVPTDEAKTESKVDRFYRTYLRNGYEGAMVRDPKAPYQHKRTKALLKYKPRDDAEFKVIDVLPGDDNSVVFRCVTDEGKTFKATKAGDKIENQKFLKNKKKYIGKMLTVQYQGFSGKNNVPLFPTAIRIRNDV